MRKGVEFMPGQFMPSPWVYVEFNEHPKDNQGKEHKTLNPLRYETLSKYLEDLKADARWTQYDDRTKDHLLNIMAARMFFNVKEHNLDALEARKLQDSENPTMEEIAAGIEKAHLELINNEVLQEYMNSKTIVELRGFGYADGHGGKLERDFAKFVCTHEGPINPKTPERYRPHAITRIEALQKQLKRLDRNGDLYEERAKEICMEILATRAAVNCTRGDKNSLKKSYDLEKSKRYFDSLMDLPLDDDELDALVRGALKSPGHGGTMEKVAQELVRKEVQSNNPLSKDIPARYQATYGDRMGILHENVAELVSTLKLCGTLSVQQRAKLKSSLAELYQLGRGAEAQKHGRQGVKLGELRIQNVSALSQRTEQLAGSGVLDKLVDDIISSDDALDQLDAALSAKGGAALEQVDRFLTQEVRKELAVSQVKRQLEDDRKKQLEISDEQVKGKNGSDLANKMNEELTKEAHDIYNNKLLNDVEKIRKLRVVCDKRMAMNLAYQKSLDAGKKLDQQEYAKQLNGARFEQSLHEVRHIPAYQRAIQNIANEMQEGTGFRFTVPTLNLHSAATDASRLLDHYTEAAKQLESEKNALDMAKEVPQAQKQNDVQRSALQ